MLSQNRDIGASSQNLWAPRGGARERGKSYTLNVRPFWICPRNTLPHNIYYSSKIPLLDTSFLNCNALAAAGLLVVSYRWEGGPKALLAAWGALWVLWLMDLPRGTRKLLSSPEIGAYLEKEGKT